MHCECESDERLFAVLLPGMDEAPAVREMVAANADWRRHEDSSLIVVPIGGQSRWQAGAEVVDYLQGVLGEEFCSSIRATWLHAQKPIEKQLNALLDAKSLDSFASEQGAALGRMLMEGRIATYFQPIIAVATGDVFAYECLLRGVEPDGKIVPPTQLLDLARRERLVFLLDRVCRETHIRNAVRANLSPETSIFINFLPTAIYNPNFCLRSTMKVIEETGINPTRIVFEVVETEKISDRDHLRRILDTYRAAGLRVALDDVGAGYAGLSMWADLAPDVIKIDRELVQRAATSELHRNLAEGMVQMARRSGTKVLAEGIETLEEERTMLELEVEVDYLQGYRYGRPAKDAARESAIPLRKDQVRVC